MNETPSSTDAVVAAHNRQLARLRTLTIVSLSLNGLILVLILIGIIAHHHHKHHGNFGGRGGGGQCCFQQDFRHGFGHHHGGMDRGGWGQGKWGGDMDRGNRHFGGNGGGFDRQEFKGEEGGGFEHHGFGDGDRGGQGFGGHHGMGMKMGGGGMNAQPPDPAKMTDGILSHLTQELTLTDDQKAKIKPLISAQVAQFQKEMDDRKQAMQKEMADGRAKIRALLNPDQQKQLDQLPVPGEKPDDKADATPPAK
jgi:hypothetical protein